MIRMIQPPTTAENTRVTRADSALTSRSSAPGRHSTAQPATGTTLITVTAVSAPRMRRVMKHWGISAKARIRVSPASTADGRNRAVAPAR